MNCKLWTVNCSLEFWMTNRNRAKASLPLIDNKKPRTCKTGRATLAAAARKDFFLLPGEKVDRDGRSHQPSRAG